MVVGSPRDESRPQTLVARVILGRSLVSPHLSTRTLGACKILVGEAMCGRRRVLDAPFVEPERP